MSERSTLVTGAAGFIGSHLVEKLLSSGWHVIGLDNFDDFYPESIKRGNLERAGRMPGFRLVEGDIRDKSLLDSILGDQKLDLIIHLAAKAGVRPSLESPQLYVDVNVRGTTTVFEAARDADVPRVVFASSSSVYGGSREFPFSEAEAVDRPISPYAATKMATELIAHTFHHLYGIDAIGLRFFTVYGPRQRPEMAIHKFTRLIDEGRPVPVFGDGTTRRDYTYIDDCIQGVMAAVERPRGFRIFNLGESSTTTLTELVEMIGQALGREPKLESLPDQPGDVPVTLANIDRARAELGYEPKTPTALGIRKFVEWYQSQEIHGSRGV